MSSRYIALAAQYKAKILTVLVVLGMLYFVIDTVRRSLYESFGIHNLYPITSNQVRLSIESFDPDSGKVVVRATPSISPSFLASDLQRMYALPNVPLQDIQDIDVHK